MSDSFVRLDAVSKSFGPTRAVADISLRLERGSIVGLVGENGAGKTTLSRLLAGEIEPDRGSIIVGDVTITGTSAASAAGVAMVHQHFLLVPNMTISENLALVARNLPPWIPPSELRRRAEAATLEAGLAIGNPDRRVEDLSVAEQASVELAKALIRDPALLILDEPTAVLMPAEVEQLMTTIRRIAESGVTVIIVTHKLREVFAIADRIVVMRRGHIVFDRSTSAATPGEVARAMVPDAADLPVPKPPSEPAGGQRLLVEKLSTRGGPHTLKLADVSFEVREREIVCIIGAAGNGQRELAAILRGIEPWTEGTIRLYGRQVSTAQLLTEQSIAHIAADRTTEGLVNELTIAENIALRRRGLSHRETESLASTAIATFSIKARSPHQEAGALSGGNQQKVLLAEALARKPQLIIASEPTRGLDFEATALVHSRISESVASGASALIITSDLEEAFSLAARIYVMFRGSLSEAVPAAEAGAKLGALLGGQA